MAKPTTTNGLEPPQPDHRGTYHRAKKHIEVAATYPGASDFVQRRRGRLLADRALDGNVILTERTIGMKSNGRRLKKVTPPIPGATVKIRETRLSWSNTIEAGVVAPPLDGSFDVPLSHGGPTALLMRADLTTQKGADAYLTRLPSIAGERLPLDALQRMQQFAQLVGHAIVCGDDRVWSAMLSAFDSVRIKDEWVAIEIVRKYLLSRDQAINAPVAEAPKDATAAVRPMQHDESTAPIVKTRAKVAIAELSTLDPSFKKVTPSRVVDLLAEVEPETRRGRGHKGPSYGLALLTLECGAFGAKVRTSAKADAGDRDVALQRVAAEYARAWSQAGKPRKLRTKRRQKRRT